MTTKKCIAVRKIDRRRLEERWGGDSFSQTLARAATAMCGMMKILHEETHLEGAEGRPARRRGAPAGTGRRSKPAAWVQVSIDERVYSILDTVADLLYHKFPKSKCFLGGKRVSYALIVASLTHVSTVGLFELSAHAPKKHQAWMIPLYLRDHGGTEFLEEDPLDNLELSDELMA